MLKIILALIGAIFLTQNSGYSQDHQNDPKTKVNSYLQHYYANDLRISFNQPVYAPSDSALFVVGSSRLMSFAKSQEIATLNILDTNGQNILKQKVKLQGGVAVNQLVFPSDMKPGLYQWIVGIDRFKLEKQSFLTGTICIVGKKKIASENMFSIVIEGNSFINGLECKLKISLFNNASTNKPIVVIDNLGNIVNKVVFDSLGKATLSFVPNEQIQSYTVSVEGAPLSSVQLPARLNKGVVLHETETNSEDSRAVKVSSNDAGLKILTFVWCSRSEVLLVNKIVLNEESERVVKVPDHLENLSYVLLLDSSLNVLAQHPILKRNDEKKIYILLQQKEFSTRDTVRIKLEAKEEIDWLVVRVLKKDLFAAASEPIRLIDQSEIGQQPLFSKQLGFHQNSKGVNYQEIRGIVSLENEVKYLDSIQVMLFLQKSILGYETYVDKDRHFKVPLVFAKEGQETVFYSVRTKHGDIFTPKIAFDTEEFVSPNAGQKSKESNETDMYGEYAFTKHIIEESFRRRVAGINDENSPNLKYEEELGGADIIRKLEDYNPFLSIEDVIREIVPAVEYRKKSGYDVVRVFTSEKRPKDSFGPLYIIDGVFFKSPSVFLNLPIVDVKIIKVVKDSKKLRAFGVLGENGIILVETKSGKALPAESQMILNGISPLLPSRIYSGSSTTNQRTVDLRACLFWCPVVKLNGNNEAELKFTTSDDLGDMVIQVEGETKSGTRIFEEETFLVSFPAKKS